MVEPSAMRKKMWKYGNFSPVDGTWSSKMVLASSIPRMRV
jgi:hypothetical protein